MTEQKDMYSIVVGVDYTDVSTSALAHAIGLARGRERSHIHVIHALSGSPWLQRGIPDPMPSPGSLNLAYVEPAATDMLNDTRAYIERVLTALGLHDSAPSVAWTLHFRHTEPASAIVQLAADLRADLIVVGTHGRQGFERFLLGSVAEKVVRLAPCPVLVMRPVGAVAATDGPQIEPVCPDCLQTRTITTGKELWCERHSQRHERAHTYHFSPFRDSHQSGLLLAGERRFR